MTQTCCIWCINPNSTEEDPARLCRTHLAEFEGLSVTEFDRSESEWANEYADTRG